MPIQLNHTIVYARSARESADFFTEIMGLPAAVPFPPFLGVAMETSVALDFMDSFGDVTSQHYAFLVSEAEFDEIFGRIQQRGVPYWADPFHQEASVINHHDGGRGVYFEDPSGHSLEIITRPYGGG